MTRQDPEGRGTGGFDRRMQDTVELIESELKHAIAYVNDAVIPQVRKESITAMRTAAETLRILADRFERQNSATAGHVAGNNPKEPQS